MTQEEITSMAQEAGFVGFDGKNKCLRKFAALVAAHEREKLLNKLEGVSEKVIYETVKEAVLAEREACAKVCDDYNDNSCANYADLCAAAIRARGEK